jgi:hypothetical protein
MRVRHSDDGDAGHDQMKPCERLHSQFGAFRFGSVIGLCNR